MRRRKALWVWVCITLVQFSGLASCARPADYQDQHLRIVSLAPAITQVLIEIGLKDAIVAVGDGDPIAPPGIPSLGSFNDLDLERLATLAPTHVLGTTGQIPLPPRVIEMGAAGRFRLLDLEYTNDIQAVGQMIRQIGVTLERTDRTEKIASAIETQLAGISAITAGRPRPRALMVFTTSPPMVSGPGTVNDELLQIAGGINAVADAALSAVTYDREGLRALATDVIFLMKPGDVPLSGPEDPRLEIFRGLDLPAIQNGRVYLLNDPAVLLPGPSIAITAASMAVALHPELDQTIAEVFRDSP